MGCSVKKKTACKKTLKKEEDNALFFKVYIFSRINYNLSPAKTLSAITAIVYFPTLAIAACAAASLAIGTRNGEHDT